MVEAIGLSPALWGALGAFAYGAPRTLFVLRQARVMGEKCPLCVLEMVLAVAIGAIFGEGFGPAIAHRIEWLAEPDGRALYLAIGLVANPIAPALIKALQGRVLKRVEGSPDA